MYSILYPYFLQNKYIPNTNNYPPPPQRTNRTPHFENVWGTGNGDPEIPELPNVRGFSWATLSPGGGGVNTEAWSSRLGVGREADNLIL
jgi:hypothetical protein